MVATFERQEGGLVKQSFEEVVDVIDRPQFAQVVDICRRVQDHYAQITEYTKLAMVVLAIIYTLSWPYFPAIQITERMFFHGIGVYMCMQLYAHLRPFPLHNAAGETVRWLSARRVANEARHQYLLQLHLFVQTWNQHYKAIDRIEALAQARALNEQAQVTTSQLAHFPEYLEDVAIPKLLDSLEEVPFGGMLLDDNASQSFRESIQGVQATHKGVITLIHQIQPGVLD